MNDTYELKHIFSQHKSTNNNKSVSALKPLTYSTIQYDQEVLIPFHTVTYYIKWSRLLGQTVQENCRA